MIQVCEKSKIKINLEIFLSGCSRFYKILKCSDYKHLVKLRYVFWSVKQNIYGSIFSMQYASNTIWNESILKKHYYSGSKKDYMSQCGTKRIVHWTELPK